MSPVRADAICKRLVDLRVSCVLLYKLQGPRNMAAMLIMHAPYKQPCSIGSASDIRTLITKPSQLIEVNLLRLGYVSHGYVELQANRWRYIRIPVVMVRYKVVSKDNARSSNSLSHSVIRVNSLALVTANDIDNYSYLSLMMMLCTTSVRANLPFNN